MCLTLRVRAPLAPVEDLRSAVAAVSSPVVTFEPVRSGRTTRWPWSRPGVPEAVAPCVCELLSDEAEWSALTWAMRPDAGEALGLTLEALARALPGAQIEVLWAGDAAEREQTVTAAELRALASASALGTKTRYRIIAPTAEPGAAGDVRPGIVPE